MAHKIQCVLVDDEPMARSILENYIAKIGALQLVKSCKNASEAFEVVNAKSIDLLFLDINMPEISGLTFAKSVSKKTKVIFTTAYREYAVDGFDLQAVDYLLKPISFDRFLQAVQKYLDTNSAAQTAPKKVKDSEKNDFIFVRSERKMVKINLHELLYVESLSDYLKLHTSKITFITRDTISNLEEKLDDHHFLRIHRSFIVNVKKIDSYTNEFIEINHTALPISRSYKENVLQKLANI